MSIGQAGNLSGLPSILTLKRLPSPAAGPASYAKIFFQNKTISRAAYSQRRALLAFLFHEFKI